MKRSHKFLALAMAATTMMAPMAGCSFGGGGGGGSSSSSQVSVDEDKIQIWAYAVDNGLTSQWIKDLAEQYNALPENADSPYQVIGDSGMTDATTTLSNALDAKTTNINIYFGCQGNLKNLIASNKLINIEDMYGWKVDGESNGTIADKTHNYSDLKLAWSDLNGNGIYGVSYGTGVSGMVFDYDWFVKNDLMKLAPTSELGNVNANGVVAAVEGSELKCTVAFGNYEVGDTILTAGKDGKYGTYDDGQVTTYEEFNTLLEDIIEIPYAYPFIYTTSSRDAYTPTVQNAVFMQELGYENMRTYQTYKGQIKDKSGNTVMNVNYENAAGMYDLDVVKDSYYKGAEFYYNYMCGLCEDIAYPADRSVHPSSYASTGFQHTEAQNAFVQAVTSPSTIKYSAFLIEGVWFEESEAKGAINTVHNLYKQMNDYSYEFGTREFRFYLYPDTPTQISTKSVMAWQDDGAGFITNNVPAEVQEMGQEAVDAYILECKKFLAFTLKEENLAFYTKQSGVPRPYDYTLTADDIADMTPFQRAAYAISQDTENIQMYRTTILSELSLIKSYAKHKGTSKPTGADAAHSSVYSAFGHATKTYTIREYSDAMMASLKNNYQAAYLQVKDYLK